MRTGSPTLSWSCWDSPDARHDDQVDALAYAAEQVATGAVGYPAQVVMAPDIDLPRPSGIFAGRQNADAEELYQRAAEFWQ